MDSREIEKITGVSPGCEEIYRRAFVHRSAHENSNERLEFVGDAVLGAIVAAYLYERYPNEDEGFLTRTRTNIVSSKGLHKIAEQIGIHNHVVMNERGMSKGWNKNKKVLEDALEALVGAVFIDKGYDSAKRFVEGLIETHVRFSDATRDTNYKDILAKAAQSRKLGDVVFDVTCTSGPDHQRWYTVQACIKHHKLSKGSGSTKKDAEQIAAYRVLKSMGLM